MSVHVEWMGAAAAVTIASAGTEIGEDTVDELAVVFGDDTGATVVRRHRSTWAIRSSRMLDDGTKLGSLS